MVHQILVALDSERFGVYRGYHIFYPNPDNNISLEIEGETHLSALLSGGWQMVGFEGGITIFQREDREYIEEDRNKEIEEGEIENS